MSLQQNTCIKYLNLGGNYYQDEETLPLIETILRNNRQLMHLSLVKNHFCDKEAVVSFMKTVIQASSLTTLDCQDTEFMNCNDSATVPHIFYRVNLNFESLTPADSFA
jgi:hypothetical protein